MYNGSHRKLRLQVFTMESTSWHRQTLVFRRSIKRWHPPFPIAVRISKVVDKGRGHRSTPCCVSSLYHCGEVCVCVKLKLICIMKIYHISRTYRCLVYMLHVIIRIKILLGHVMWNHTVFNQTKEPNCRTFLSSLSIIQTALSPWLFLITHKVHLYPRNISLFVLTVSVIWFLAQLRQDLQHVSMDARYVSWEVR